MKLSDEILFEVEDGGIAVITIDRPQARNAINQGVIDGLRLAWQRFAADEALRVAILTGSGDKAFCAGMDLKQAAATGLRVPPRDMFPVLGDTVKLDKPVIAAVNGVAYAGGFLFAQMCDLCVASDNAAFGITEAKVGRGMPWAAPLAQLRDKALQMARAIAANAPLTVKAARELVYLSGEMGRSAALRAAYPLFESVYLSEDAQEGPRAFAEKRAPRWSGR